MLSYFADVQGLKNNSLVTEQRNNVLEILEKNCIATKHLFGNLLLLLPGVGEHSLECRSKLRKYRDKELDIRAFITGMLDQEELLIIINHLNM